MENIFIPDYLMDVGFLDHLKTNGIQLTKGSLYLRDPSQGRGR